MPRARREKKIDLTGKVSGIYPNGNGDLGLADVDRLLQSVGEDLEEAEELREKELKRSASQARSVRRPVTSSVSRKTVKSPEIQSLIDDVASFPETKSRSKSPTRDEMLDDGKQKSISRSTDRSMQREDRSMQREDRSIDRSMQREGSDEDTGTSSDDEEMKEITELSKIDSRKASLPSRSSDWIHGEGTTTRSESEDYRREADIKQLKALNKLEKAKQALYKKDLQLKQMDPNDFSQNLSEISEIAREARNASLDAKEVAKEAAKTIREVKETLAETKEAETDIQQTLLDYQYVPISKIEIENETGDKTLEYIKAFNKLGKKVYVVVDQPGHVPASSKDIVVKKVDKPHILPGSMKAGAMACAGFEIGGIAFECQNDIAVLSRDSSDPNTVVDSTFTIKNAAGSGASGYENLLKRDNVVLPFPIIKLSEIIEHGELILESTEKVYTKLMNNIYENNRRRLFAFQATLKTLYKRFDEYDKLRNDKADKLNGIVTKLNEYNKRYFELGIENLDTDLLQKFRQTQYNLRIKNDNVAQLVETMNRVADLQTKVEEIIGSITDIIKYCNETFYNVDQPVGMDE